MFEKKREHDKSYGNSSVGPHRDDYIFTMGDEKMRKFSSQGQAKSGVLSLKLAVVEYIKEKRGEYPILLLDDLTSELDRERLNYFLSYVVKKGQIILTTTGLKYFSDELIKNARLIEIEKGRVIHV